MLRQNTESVEKGATILICEFFTEHEMQKTYERNEMKLSSTDEEKTKQKPRATSKFQNKIWEN